MYDRRENCWPMILLGGATETGHEGIGGFQEWPQLESVRTAVKFAARPASIDLIPRHLERAVRTSVYGRPGPCYIDLPGDLLNTRAPASSVRLLPAPAPPTIIPPSPENLEEVATVLKNSSKPLIILGKGAAYARAEAEIRKFAAMTNIPVLATPMGKGVIPDSSPSLVSAARSTALEGADTVLLLGARLNWMLHFGQPPRWCARQPPAIIQVDICAEELHNSVPARVALQADIRATVAGLCEVLGSWTYPDTAPWWAKLRDKMTENVAATRALAEDASTPLNYYAAFDPISDLLTEDTYVVSEGANTMDIGRTMLLNSKPRHRLDAGTFGTMGLGLGFAIATALYVKKFDPKGKVLCVEGDSAFGFSGMEVETIARYKLPIVLVIINNNGVLDSIDIEQNHVDTGIIQ